MKTTTFERSIKIVLSTLFGVDDEQSPTKGRKMSIGLLLFFTTVAFSQSDTFTSNGTFTVPAGVTAVQVQAWGGGGAGGGCAGGAFFSARAGGGGAGGSFTRNNSVTVSPNSQINVTVGSGGAGVSGGSGGTGGTSTFASPVPVTAIGGAGGGIGSNGAGGAVTSGVTFNGGAGGNATSNNGAGGGGGAGSSGAGGNASGTTAGAGGAGGGGTGAAGRTSAGDGIDAAALSGGGGGGKSASAISGATRTGGDGYRGQVIVSYTCPSYDLTSALTAVTPLCGSSAGTVTFSSASMPTGNYQIKYSLSGATTLSNQTATVSFTAGSPGTASFSTQTLAVGVTNITINEIASGGCSTVQVANNNTSITIVASPTAVAGTALSICETTTSLNVSAGASATNYTSVLWTSSGTGSFNNADSVTLATYNPSAADIAAGSVTLTLTANAGAPCSNVSSNKLLSISKTPTAVGGGSATVCVSQSAIVSGMSATNGTISWTHNGSGSITAGATTVSPTYTPAAADGNHAVTLTMTVSNAPCTSATANFVVNVIGAATANAGTAVSLCTNSGAVNITSGATASNYSNLTWTSNGSGTISNPNSLTLATYTPGSGEVGTVTLTLTATGNTPCGNTSSNKSIVINPIPVVSGVTQCQGQPSQALQSATSCPFAAAVTTPLRTSATAVNNTGTGSEAWTNPGNITSAGSPYATVSTNFSISNYLFATNYGFSIPAGSMINGITVTVNRQGSSTQFGLGINDNVVSLIKGGTVTGANNASSDNWPTTMATASYGGTADLWGSSWTAADINASNFGVALSAVSILSRTGTVDYIRVSVTYSPPGDLKWYTVSSGGTAIGTGSSFNPVGVAGSGLANTNTPGTTTYYVECSTIAGCRAPVNYVINALPTVSFTGLAASYCENAAPVLLTGNHAPSGTFSGAGITDNGNGTATFSAVSANVGPHQITYSYTDGNSCLNTNVQTVTVLANTTYYADADGDGFGNIAVTQLSCTGAPVGFVLDNTDCDDNNIAAHQTFSFYADADGDSFGAGSLVSVCAVDALTPPAGYSLNDTDCNDANPSMHATFSFYADADGDGYGAGSLVAVCAVDALTPPAGYSLSNTDCDDNNGVVYQSGVLYVDADNDGYTSGDTQVVCYGASTPSGFVASLTAIDCNDTVAAINPGHAEVLYNGVDDNCDGQLDEGFRITTSLLPSSCGTTLASIGSLIGITTLAPGSAYTGWRIRLTNGAQVQVIEKNVPHFTLPEFPSYAYATTYTVEIELQRNGVWLGYYGPACLVSTPAILEEGGASAVSPSQCGITLPKINTLIATTSLQGVTGYRFQVTNLTDPLGPNAVQTIDRTQNWFSLPMLTRYNYGTTYRIEIAVKTTGTYGGFGAPCEVSSPPAPSLINCGGIAASGTSTVAATSVQGATQYRFQITRQSDLASATIDRSTNYFIFNSVPASAFTPGALYGIRVAVMTSGFWSPFGDACEYTAPGGASKGAGSDAAAVASEFRATAYPNPFTSDFGIDVTSSNPDNVQVRVYDMLGKLIEDRSVRLQDLSLEKVGAQYPSGVYNVIVTQGEIVKTLRVIKR